MTRSVALFAVSLAVGTSLPFAATESLRALTRNSVIRGPDGTVVQLHRAYSWRDRYDYNRAILLYELRLQQGQTGLVKPDINRRETIDVYLRNPVEDRVQIEEVRTEPVSTVDYVKSEEDVVGVDALTVEERAALARYVRVGKCWYHAKFTAGFYDLCLKLIRGKQAVRTTGFGTDLQSARVRGRVLLKGAASSRSRTLYEGLKDNRSQGRVSGYGKKGGRAGVGSSSSASR